MTSVVGDESETAAAVDGNEDNGEDAFAAFSAAARGELRGTAIRSVVVIVFSPRETSYSQFLYS